MDPATLLLCLWVRDGEWEFRIDTPHQPPPLGERHIHVRRKRRRKGEYAWNVSGSRHDKHKFPVNDDLIQGAKRIASKHLGVPESNLHLILAESSGRWVINVADSAREVSIVLNAVGRLIVLATDDRLVFIAARDA